MFYKFPKLNNIDNITGPLIKFTKEHQWVVTEKIDGANCSIIVDREGNVNFAGRNHVIDDTYDVYHFSNMIKHDKKFAELVAYITKLVKDHQFETINVFGEYFGRGIQDRIDYGNQKYVRIYSCLINGKHWCGFDEFNTLFNNLDRQFFIPVLGRFETFEQAVEFANAYGVTNNKISELAPQCGEGVVIYSATSHEDILVAYKHKCDQFKELKKLPIVKQMKAAKYSSINALHEEFMQYATENRMYNVISKLGVPSDKSQYGAYARAFVEDAIEDFKLDHPNVLEDLDKNEIKQVFNLGSSGFLFLKEILSKLNIN